MGFKDDIGCTIVLDAIMTDLGRQRMAAGNLVISKYAFGDDEIDYALGYEDLSAGYVVLSASTTPLLEAFNHVNGDINYGLLSYNRNDLRYLPIIKPNEKLDQSVWMFRSGSNAGTYSPIGNTYYLSVNDETTNKLKEDLGDYQYILEHDSHTAYKIILESGIEDITSEGAVMLPRDPEARDAFIIRPDLLDNYITAHADGRFIQYIIGPQPSCIFRNTQREKADVNFAATTQYTQTSLDMTFKHYFTYNITTVPNLMYNKGEGLDLDTSAIAGPRGSATAINFCVDTSLTTTSEGSSNYKYNTHGTTSKDLFNNGNQYDFIDTAVLIVGANSQYKLQLPLRIIRYAGQ